VLRLLILLLVVAGGGVYLTRLVARRRRERLAQVRAVFLVSPRPAREHGPELKDVALRSGAVRLRLPRHWTEEYADEDHASFRDPGSPQRVLRLTGAAVASAPLGLRELLRSRAGQEATTVEDLPEGRVLLRSLDATREAGQEVVVFRWLSAAPLPSAVVRLATFTFSVPEKTALDPLTRDVVTLLDLEIRSARLA
jgi:hypothetical protein